MTNGEIFKKQNPNIECKENGTCMWIYWEYPNHYTMPMEWWNAECKENEDEDCISRADAIKAMQDKAKELTNEDTINGLCGAVAILFNMPSVTPQEPILDKIRAEIMEIFNEEKDVEPMWALGLKYSTHIIDKYKAETEVENGND